MNRNVWLLFACQALMNAVMAGQTIMASLVGYRLSGGMGLNTLPMAIQQIGVMCASVPAARIFARYGRKAGFWMGCGVAMCGSVLFAVGIWTENFPLYVFAAFPAGIGHGVSQHLRFAAAEVAAPEARPRAISLVLAGGVLAAIVGPEMVEAHPRPDPRPPVPRDLSVSARAAAGDAADPVLRRAARPRRRGRACPCRSGPSWRGPPSRRR